MQLLRLSTQLQGLMRKDGQTNVTCAFLCAKKKIDGDESVTLAAWEVDVDACSSPGGDDRLGGSAAGGKDYAAFLRKCARQQSGGLEDRKSERATSTVLSDKVDKLWKQIDNRSFLPPRFRGVDGLQWAIKGAWMKGLGTASVARLDEVDKILEAFVGFQATGDNDEAKARSRHAFFSEQMPFPADGEVVTGFKFFWPHDTSLPSLTPMSRVMQCACVHTLSVLN